MIRFIIAVIHVTIVMILSLVLQPIALLIGLFSKKARAAFSGAFVKYALCVVNLIAGVKVQYIGLSNIPKNESVLYIMNHRGLFDIIASYPKIPGRVGFVAKNEMSKLLMFSWWMKLINCQFLDRSNLRQGMQMIKDSANLVKDGTSIVICPEGTRNRTEETMLEFHKGSFKIAEKAECKLIPCVVNGADDVFEKHFPKLKKTKMIIEFLPAIDVKELSTEKRKELCENVRNKMITTYQKNDKIRMELN